MIISLCQLNPIVGNINYNLQLLFNALEKKKDNKCDLFVFPELFLQGYPPKDLLEKRWFLEQSQSAIKECCNFSKKFPDSGIIVGTILPSHKKFGKPLINGAVFIYNGSIIFTVAKTLLPTYDVFDESRYFEFGEEVDVISFKGEKIGITICEDVWNVSEFLPKRLYKRDPVAELANKGASLIINISASPFEIEKDRLRYKLISKHAKTHSIPFVFVNQVGGNDELIFDGSSMFFDRNGNLQKKLPSFKEDIDIINTDKIDNSIRTEEIFSDNTSSAYEALVLGLKDYVRKCGFNSILLGLSGGIDSAVTAVLSTAAVGAENVWGITMPSRYSSEGSIKDSQELAKRLGIKFSIIPIEDIFCSFLSTLKPTFVNQPENVAEENLQARIRGTILMAISNKYSKYLLVSTGNKSELSVGYSTLYGDMNGGLAVISDVPKKMVYELAYYINKDREIIPESIIKKPPSAELRYNQKDEDTLPPYSILDTIIEKMIEDNKSINQIISEGFDETTVKWVADAIAKSEYKRKQAPPGLKITSKAFGSGRRFPIAAKYERIENLKL